MDEVIKLMSEAQMDDEDEQEEEDEDIKEVQENLKAYISKRMQQIEVRDSETKMSVEEREHEMECLISSVDRITNELEIRNLGMQFYLEKSDEAPKDDHDDIGEDKKLDAIQVRMSGYEKTGEEAWDAYVSDVEELQEDLKAYVSKKIEAWDSEVSDEEGVHEMKCLNDSLYRITTELEIPYLGLDFYLDL